VSARRWTVLFFVALAVFFFIANRGAYKGYFQDDDLDNLAFTRELPLSSFVVPLIYPRVYPNNFRPVGHLFYRWMGQTAGLHYTPYIAYLHLLHFANIFLLWLILKRLGLNDLAAGTGALFFAFHMAVFEVFWMPMYVFDLLCGFFCLLSLLAYLDNRWILSLAAMFIAYRAKEVAIMLPVVFAAYEFLIGPKRWRRLLPFFALSSIIGIQAIVQNHARGESDYTLHLDPSSVWQCIQFYSGRVFLIPYAGLLILLLLAVVRDRRFLFGAAAFSALLLPMLLLPGRLFSAYLYVPLIGLSIAAAALAALQRPLPIALFFAAWLPWNYVNLRWQRRAVLADAADRRAFSRELTAFNRSHPDILAYVYGMAPVNGYGTHAIIKLAHPIGAPLRFATLEDPGLPSVLAAQSVAIVSWDSARHQLRTVVKTPQNEPTGYLQMTEDTPIWQLGQGWYPLEGSFRWAQPEATARLTRPSDAAAFEIVVNISPRYLEKIPRNHLTVTLDGAAIGEHEFTRPGWQTVRWKLQPAGGGPVNVGIHVTPEFYLNRKLGIAVGGFGFVPRATQSRATQ
jgi:hypothetical protein